MNQYYVRSHKFPILPGEEEELLNEGTYGKALAEYLKAKLRERGYTVPFVCCEDWGWWVEVADAPFVFGVGLGYSGEERDGLLVYTCFVGLLGRRKWSWRRWRFVETAPWAERLDADLLAVFQADPEVELVNVSDGGAF